MPNRALELVSRTSTSLTVRAINLPADASGVNWYFGTSTGSMPFVESWDGVTGGATAAYTFSGLQPDTLYYIKFLPYDAHGGRIDPAYTDSFTTAPELAITGQPKSVTATGGYVYFTVSARGDGLAYRWQYSANGGSTWSNTALTGYDTDTLRVMASAANNGRQYRCVITDRYGNSVTSDPATLTVVAAGTRPTNWAWESDVTQGADFGMTAAEWNDFLDRIFAFAAYKGVALSGAASDYHVTTGTDMLASQANAARSLVAALAPPTAPPAAVSSGVGITAAFFLGLRNSLNSIT